MQAVCPKCSCEYRCKKNEVSVEELGMNGEKFRVRSGDLWACPICHNEVVIGFGRAVHAYEPVLYGAVLNGKPLVQIK